MALFISALVTVSSAFAGAWLAFYLEERRRQRQNVLQHVSALNRALYTLFNYWNILIQYQDEVIDPVRDSHDRWLNMLPSPPSSYGLTSFDADELVFLLQTKQANIFSELLLEEQRFWSAIKLIEVRSTDIMNVVNPKLGATGIAIGTPISEKRIEEIVGTDMVQKLKQITSGIICNIDEDIISIRNAYENLRTSALTIYPDEKFISIKFNSPSS